ncbi:hypothetical protein [Methylobacterium haplocladii]|uniref:DUF3035 domain-containing protein n=1 Tax=Methylobacterium haplocladii TaxID=1176176 RepID=A0A512IKT9_9HYPH|nr:hypothetical protein [Methylobacterium haplocladii]GEO98340.1 hypothetical protein MHA02_07280 [Methylobacterium haplocladii]GJD82968.1 hypothetical protein HPGCJGGD_0830 [Methylobacterium haplocladii]GLS58733.1 hypothetical protein GCM10007887_13980 [Methylobacterium haplocladii]
MIAQRGILSVVTGTFALGLFAVAPARAAEGEFMRDAMSSIGLIEPERPPITYRERAPLVMPPALGKKAAVKKPAKGKGAEAPPVDYATMPLPLPQTRQDDPQWPKDPEISRRERAAIDAKKPIVRGAQGRMNDNNETLSAFEMQNGRKAGAGLSSEPAPSPGEARESTWMNPLKLFSGRKDDDEPSAIEPDRDGLTDPPNGYRKPPIKAAKAQGGPVGNSISGNEEADPRAFTRAQSAR